MRRLRYLITTSLWSLSVIALLIYSRLWCPYSKAYDPWYSVENRAFITMVRGLDSVLGLLAYAGLVMGVVGLCTICRPSKCPRDARLRAAVGITQLLFGVAAPWFLWPSIERYPRPLHEWEVLRITLVAALWVGLALCGLLFARASRST